MHNFVSILVCNYFEEEEKAGCFAIKTRNDVYETLCPHPLLVKKVTDHV